MRGGGLGGRRTCRPGAGGIFSVFHVKPGRSVDNYRESVDPHAQRAIPGRWITVEADSLATPVSARFGPLVRPSSAPPDLVSSHRSLPHRTRSARRMRTTVTGGCTTAAPTLWIATSVPPARRMASVAAATSSAADDPFMASTWPPGRVRGRDQPTSRSMRSHCSGGHHVEPHLEPCFAFRVLGPSAMDVGVGQPHLAHSEVEKLGATQQRLQHFHANVGTTDREHQPGQSRPAADVAHRAPRRGSAPPAPRS